MFDVESLGMLAAGSTAIGTLWAWIISAIRKERAATQPVCSNNGHCPAHHVNHAA